jgi:hypothetical protein
VIAAAASPLTSAAFIAIVVLVAIGFVRAAMRARVSGGMVLTVFIVAIVIPGVLANAGQLDRYSPLPAPALVVTGLVTMFTIVLALSSTGERVAASVSLASLVGYQVFRVAVELVLHRLYLEDVVPVQMTYAGRNFDILSGLSAIVLALAMWSGRRPRAIVFLWNLAGLGLLVNIVVIAVVSTPVPFRQFANDPPNLLPSTFPFVWLPTFLVQAALFGHLVVFRALRRQGSRY